MNNSTMFIPKQIHIGFNNRDNTYTGKLGYIIYTDDKGIKRKVNSWESWRDKKIPVIDEKNEPISGFVLNKKAGGYCSSWNTRKTTTRVYDPRGFEIEISIENLLFILEHTNSYKGKGLEGDFVYAFSGKDLVLLPINSEDYKQSKEYSDILFNKDSIKPKDLVIGHTYSSKTDNMVYLGKYVNYDSPNKTKEFYFMVLGKYGKIISVFKSISNKFFKDNGEKHPEFDDFFKELDKESSYSPIDESKSIYEDMTNDDVRYNSWIYYINNKGEEVSAYIVDKKENINSYYYYNNKKNFMTKEDFLKLKPKKKKVYLKSGHLHKKIGYKNSY